MLHRIHQFLSAGQQPSAADLAFAAEWLPSTLVALYRSQHPRDAVHGARTARWLLARGHRDADLVAAALVHDAGKGQQRPTDRAAFVVAESLRLSHRLASPGSRWEIRRAGARSRVHAEVGADVLRSLGAPDRVVDLTLQHHSEPRGDVMLALLQQADAAN